MCRKAFKIIQGSLSSSGLFSWEEEDPKLTPYSPLHRAHLVLFLLSQNLFPQMY